MTISTPLAFVIGGALMGGVFWWAAVAYRKQHGKWPW